MSFFADLPEPENRYAFQHARQPEWAGPTGLNFSVEIVRRPGTGGEDEDDDLFMDFHPPRRREGRFRLGVQFADGRRVTGDHEWPGPGEGPRLTPHGGGGGGLHYDQEFWLWPLPPEGQLVFACEWPARGLDETLAEIDAGPIRAAAARAVELWPDERPVAGDDDEW